MRKLSAKWVPKFLNADQKCQWCQSSEQIWNFFGAIKVISCCDWWPWTKPGHTAMARRQSKRKQSDGIAAHPASKISECKNPLENFSPRFFRIKMTSSSLIIFERAKLSTQSITHLCWFNWRTFWRKNASGRSPRVSCSCMTMPRLTGHLQPRRNWPAWASNVLITHHILRIWPRRTTTYSLDWKKQLQSGNFSSDAEVTDAAETWLDGQPSEFLLSDVHKLEQRAKKCIELLGKYVE